MRRFASSRRDLAVLIRLSRLFFFLILCLNMKMLYTGKGDKGQTKLYHCDQKLSKSSQIAEALGTLDEINSLLGWCKVVAERGETLSVPKVSPRVATVASILEETQNSLFSVQAELAGAPKKLSKTAVTKIEALINVIDKELPPIKSFIIPGGTELSAMLDVARTVARGAERQVVAVAESGNVKIQSTTLAYLNRLSSLLYALARLVNNRAGIVEKKPLYR
ncbi:MAG: cob(I)yrinic acid a,c-diamide adenosyltransferase [Candidatus Vogelbacteria bacterium]|nr:cob(I)yrinic acid a,c-diamide adenosyltransferase [Candidatus Vogelbacteria bacterium]